MAIFLPMISLPTLGDQYFGNVVQLSHFHGTNGSQTFTNSVSRGAAFIAGAQTGSDDVLSTSQFVFGPTSYRRGALGTQHINAGTPSGGNTGDFNFGTGDFTIEMRFRTDNIAQNAGAGAWIFDMNSSTTSQPLSSMFYTGTGGISYFVNNAVSLSSATGLMTSNTWYALAITRIGTTLRLFINGTVVATGTDSVNYNASLPGVYLSSNTSRSNNGTNQNYEEFRITKGVGRYSANYTVASTPFPDH